MTDTNSHLFGQSATMSSAESNKVLRNTYYLLALSLLPTAFGAWIGIETGLFQMFRGGFITMIVMFAVMIGFGYLIERNRNNGLGVALMLGFTFIMGLFLSSILAVALSLANGASIITMAALGTAGIFFGLASYASVTKRDFTKMGKALMIGLIMLIAAAVANIFFQMPALALTISTLAIGLFSLLILYDLQRVLKGGETSYISAALGVYISLFNIFTSLLHLLMAFSGEKD